MAGPDSLGNAVRSLLAALDLLEAAVERRAQSEAARADLAEELAVLEEDRSRLGEEVERERRDAERLRIAQAAVAERLARMDEACAAALDRPDL